MGSGFVLLTASERAAIPLFLANALSISLIIKVTPGMSLDRRVRDGLEPAVRSAVTDDRVQVRFSYPTHRDHAIGRQPFESAADSARLEAFVAALRAVRPDRHTPEAAPLLVGASDLRGAQYPRSLFRARRYSCLPHCGGGRVPWALVI